MRSDLTNLTDALEGLHARGLHRRRRMLSGAQGVEVCCDGRPVLNFSSNDYLGLANHPDVVQAFVRGAERYGVGAGASHLVSGHSVAHHALEEALADFVACERALLFSTGYMANLGTIGALVGRGDWIFEDRLNHASLLDGGLLSGARLKRYPHADVVGLRQLLLSCSEGTKLIVTDGVFSMDGDLAPLPALIDAARESDARLMIDDAHGLGVLGRNGAGTLEYFGLTRQVEPILVGTLGKALGTFGAFVAGQHDLIEFLVQRARTYIYTTALPPAVAEATRVSLGLVKEQSWRREKLHALVVRFRDGARQLGLDLSASPTPIQAVLLGDNERALAVSEALWEGGLWVSAIRPPTVPAGTARLRVTFSAMHEDRHVDSLLDAFARLPKGLVTH